VPLIFMDLNLSPYTVETFVCIKKRLRIFHTKLGKLKKLGSHYKTSKQLYSIFFSYWIDRRKLKVSQNIKWSVWSQKSSKKAKYKLHLPFDACEVVLDSVEWVVVEIGSGLIGFE